MARRRDRQRRDSDEGMAGSSNNSSATRGPDNDRSGDDAPSPSKNPRRPDGPLTGKRAWLTISALGGFLGGLVILRDAATLLVREGWRLGGEALFGWLLAIVGVTAVIAANLLALGRRIGWSVLLGVAALVTLTGVLTLLGGQPAGVVLAVAGGGLATALWLGRTAI